MMDAANERSIILTKPIIDLNDFLCVCSLVEKQLKTTSRLMLQLYEEYEMENKESTLKVENTEDFETEDDYMQCKVNIKCEVKYNKSSDSEGRDDEYEENDNSDFEKENTVVPIVKFEQKGKIQCPECGKWYSSQCTLRDHRNRVHNFNVKLKTYDCEFCNESLIFDHRNKFMQHKHKCKKDIFGKAFLCTDCGKNYSSQNSLTAHRKSMHEKRMRNLECPFCKTIITARHQSYLDVHIRSCNVANSPEYDKFECERCHKRHQNKEAFEKHIGKCLLKPSPKPVSVTEYPCNYDGCTFVTKRLLTYKNHVNTVHLNLPKISFPCKYCDKIFYRKSSLKFHTDKIHLKISLRSHLCPQCGAGFESKQLLRNHLLTHSDVLSFFCKYCGKGFKLKSVIYRHELSCQAKH